MRLPVRLVRGGWPRFVERPLARFVRPDPAELADPAVSPETFRRLVSQIHVGDTIKITAANRHPQSDALLLDNVDVSGRTIVDLGASDGTTSLELIHKLPDFGHYVVADLYLRAYVEHYLSHFIVYDESGTCVLVSGRRLVAWPATSRIVRLLYAPLIARARRRRAERDELLLLNPEVRALMQRDARISCQTHDVFTVWDGPRPDVIKVANLLRRLYFSDADIRRALKAVHASLATGGHLLLVDNPRIAGISEHGGLYRRTPNGFRRVAATPELPEIDELITGLVVDTADSVDASVDRQSTA